MFLKRHHYLNKRMPLMKKFHWIALIFTLASLLAACGPTGPAEVQLTLSEFGISPDDITVPAGEVIFQIQNDGALEHDFVIEGVTGESGLILPGASGTFQVTGGIGAGDSFFNSILVGVGGITSTNSFPMYFEDGDELECVSSIGNSEELFEFPEILISTVSSLSPIAQRS